MSYVSDDLEPVQQERPPRVDVEPVKPKPNLKGKAGRLEVELLQRAGVATIAEVDADVAGQFLKECLSRRYALALKVLRQAFDEDALANMLVDADTAVEGPQRAIKGKTPLYDLGLSNKKPASTLERLEIGDIVEQVGPRAGSHERPFGTFHGGMKHVQTVGAIKPDAVTPLTETRPEEASPAGGTYLKKTGNLFGFRIDSVGVGTKVGTLPRGAKVAVDPAAHGLHKSKKPFRVVEVLPSPVAKTKHEGQKGYLSTEHLVEPEGGQGTGELQDMVQGTQTHNTQGREVDEEGHETLTASPLEQQTTKKSTKKERRLGTLDQALESTTDMSTKVNFGGLKLKKDEISTGEGSKSKFAEMESSGNVAAGFLGFAKGVRSMQKAKGAKKLEGLADAFSSGAKLGRGVAQLNNVGEKATTPAGQANAIMGAIGDSIDSFKKAALAIREAVTHKSKKKSLADVGIETIGVIKTGVVAATNLLAAFDKVGASRKIGRAVPPLGIALDIATAIKQFWTAHKASQWEKEMGGNELLALGKMEDALENTLSEQGADLSEVLVKEKRGVFFFRKRYDRVNPWVLSKLREHDWSEGDCQLALSRSTTVSISMAQYARIQEYEFASKMFEINRTRKVKNRSAAVKSIVKATSKAVGMGAPAVGIALETAIAGGEVLYAAGRLIQKARRNKQGKGVRNAISTSETMKDFSSKKKGSDQSTHQKRVEYAQHAKFLFQTIAALPVLDGQSSPEHRAQHHQAERYLKSTGVDTEKLYAETDVEEQFKLLVKAMEAR